MPEPGPGGDRGSQLVAGHRPVGERLSDSLAEEWPVRWRQAVVTLPAGELPHPAGGPQGKVRATVLRGQQVGGATKREGLDDPAFGQGTSDLARPGPFAPGADGKLGRRIELGLDRAEAAHNACDRFGSDRVEQLLPHTPRKSAGPAERHAQTITGWTRVRGATGLEPASSTRCSRPATRGRSARRGLGAVRTVHLPSRSCSPRRPAPRTSRRAHPRGRLRVDPPCHGCRVGPDGPGLALGDRQAALSARVPPMGHGGERRRALSGMPPLR